jgi:hypothetical protein
MDARAEQAEEKDRDRQQDEPTKLTPPFLLFCVRLW